MSNEVKVEIAKGLLKQREYLIKRVTECGSILRPAVTAVVEKELPLIDEYLFRLAEGKENPNGE